MEPGVHEELQDIIRDMGRDLGLYGGEEVKLDNYRLDVIWQAVDGACPLAVFEISSNCDFQRAFDRLKDARTKYGRPLLRLIVEKEADADKAEKILINSHAELMGKLQIWTIEDVTKYNKIIKNYCKVITKIFPENERPRFFFRRW
jgi:hypothetical protein